VLAVPDTTVQAKLLVWIFLMRVMMVVASGMSYLVSNAISKAKYAAATKFDFEHPLTQLVWITSLLSVAVTFVASYLLLPPALHGALWWVLSVVISCGTLAGALIPEFTKIFTSTHSRHVKEVVTSAKQGGASLNILSGFVAGNFSAFWEGLLIMALMAISYVISLRPEMVNLLPPELAFASSIFAFGLVAFGFLGMGPVTIAVDSFGPVSDNAQSVYELSRIEAQPDIKADIEKSGASHDH